MKEIKSISHLIEYNENFPEVNKALTDLQEETEKLLNNNFELWREECTGLVKSGELT